MTASGTQYTTMDYLELMHECRTQHVRMETAGIMKGHMAVFSI